MIFNNLNNKFMLQKTLIQSSKILLLSFCLFTMFSGCKTTVNPEANPETFSFMINGKLWLPHGVTSRIRDPNPNPQIAYSQANGSLIIIAHIYLDELENGNEIKEMFQVFTHDVKGVGEYNFPSPSLSWFAYYNVLDFRDHTSSDTDYYISTGKVIVTKLDITNKIVAGTFSFNIEEKRTGKKITITDGRFNMPLIVL